MVWQVYGFIASKSKNYDGKGSKAHTVWRDFDDEPSAHRFAKALVESGNCLTASVTRLATTLKNDS